MRLAALAPIFLLILSSGCSRRPVATPRPEAYPRVSQYPASFHNVALPFGPDSLTVNDSARVSLNADGWIDISYPAYGLTVNATLTPVSPASAPAVIDNRLERIGRNLGAARAESATIGRGVLIVAPTALRTPVQLLATDSTSWVLSGAAVASWPAQTNPDSVAPLIDALARDMTILLKNL